MQIDLQPPLVLEKASQNGKDLAITHEGNAHFIMLADRQVPGSHMNITLQYGGIQKWHDAHHGMEALPGKGIRDNKPFVTTSCRDWAPAYGGPARIICTTSPTVC